MSLSRFGECVVFGIPGTLPVRDTKEEIVVFGERLGRGNGVVGFSGSVHCEGEDVGREGFGDSCKEV